jgi:hypothetical protein
MRSKWAAAALAGVVGVVLTGCAQPPGGADGNLTNDWPALPPATVAVPHVGECYDESFRTTAQDSKPIDCAGDHYSEVAAVGTFTGEAADRQGAPDDNHPSRAIAYGDCERGAAEYLGGDWHTSTLWLTLVTPSAAAWKGGARWYRCDLVKVGVMYAQIQQYWTGSYQGDLKGGRKAAAGCVLNSIDANKNVTEAKPVDCATPHTAEFAGVYTASNGPWEANQETRWKLWRTGCETVVAKFLGYGSVAEWHNSQLSAWAMYDIDQLRWRLGDHATPCYAYAFTPSGKMVGSVKGFRDRAPNS